MENIVPFLYESEMGIEKGFFITKNGEKQIHGLFESFYGNGKSKKRGEYQYGKPTGEFIEWYENGNKKIVNHYDKKTGEEIGLYQRYYDNGQLQKECYYKKFEYLIKPDGKYCEWYNNGQMSYETTYIDSGLSSYNAWNMDGTKKQLKVNKSI